jgi:crotonobetainyl-CoA:carnitine CoA-transferase CaiB-like acyl-CoA transferase
MSERETPLGDIRVLDLGIITAGASTSALLADLGADVMKVEAGSYLDLFRGWDGRQAGIDWWNRSRFFRFTNRNKRGIGIELKDPRGRALFLQLVSQCDVVLENFRRGVMERLGLTFSDLVAANPRIILASITSQGEHGPDCADATYGSTLEATSGLAAMTGYSGGPPVISGLALNYPDQIVSIFAAGAIVAAVLQRRRTNAAIQLDISQRELGSFLLGEFFVAADDNQRTGNADPTAALQACVQTLEAEWIAIRVGFSSVAALDRLLGLTEPGVDLRERTLRAWAAIRRCDEALTELQAIGLRASKVLDATGLYDAVLVGGRPVAYAHDPTGDWTKGFPFQFRMRTMRIARPAPNLGEHTEEILRELLGLDGEIVAQMARAGTTATRPRER